MAEGLLDEAQVACEREEPGGQRVPKDVRADVAGQAGLLGPALKPAGEVARGDTSSCAADEQGWAILGQLPSPFEVPLKQTGRAPPDVANLMRTALGLDGGSSQPQVDIADVQAHQLSDSHSGGEQHLDHHAVTGVQQTA